MGLTRKQGGCKILEKPVSLKGKIINLKTIEFCEECKKETKTKVYLDHDGYGIHLKCCVECEVPR